MCWIGLSQPIIWKMLLTFETVTLLSAAHLVKCINACGIYSMYTTVFHYAHVQVQRKQSDKYCTFGLNLKRHHVPLVGCLGFCMLSPLTLCGSSTRTSVSSREILLDTAGLDFPHSSHNSHCPTTRTMMHFKGIRRAGLFGYRQQTTIQYVDNSRLSPPALQPTIW